YCETDQPVDDILVTPSERGRAFGQVKHTLAFGMSASSALASTIDQFVRQFWFDRSRANNSGSSGLPLDPARDRLVLVTSPGSSIPVREHLPGILFPIRSGATSRAWAGAAANADQRKALRVIRAHIES